MLADMVVDTTGARTLVYQVGDEIDRGELDRKTLHAKAAVVKLAASEAAGRVVDNAVQIHGGRGYMRDFAVERSVSRAAGRPRLGGHVRNPAPDHRQRDRQAWSRRPAGVSFCTECGTGLRIGTL